MNLIEIENTIINSDFADEMSLYRTKILENIKKHFLEVIEQIENEINYREESESLYKFKDEAVRTTMKNGGEQCDNPKCVCHEEEEEE